MNIGKTEKRRGRPATGRDPTVTIRLPAALLEWIDSQAQKNETGRSEMIRRLIEESRLGVPPGLSQIRTAYHEAGHAVVARVLGIPVTMATINPGTRSLGHVVFGESAFQMHTRLCEAGGAAKDRAVRESTAWRTHIMAIMAGREAEIAILGFHHDDKGDRQDKRDINRLAKWLDYKARDEILHSLRVDTMQLVSNTARSIRRVAGGLRQSASLDQNQIDQIITEMDEKLSPSLLEAFGLKQRRRPKVL
jgi:hypothetical protein